MTDRRPDAKYRPPLRKNLPLPKFSRFPTWLANSHAGAVVLFNGSRQENESFSAAP